MICPSCGYANLAGAELCESCQNPLTDADAARQTANVFE